MVVTPYDKTEQPGEEEPITVITGAAAWNAPSPNLSPDPSNFNSRYLVDGTDGAFTGYDGTVDWGGNSSSEDSLTNAVWTLTVVPEPSTALLLGLGLTGLAGKGRKRNRS
jgi:hypothetical protein